MVVVSRVPKMRVNLVVDCLELQVLVPRALDASDSVVRREEQLHALYSDY